MHLRPFGSRAVLLMLFAVGAAFAGSADHKPLTGRYEIYPELHVNIAEKDGGLFLQLPHQPLLAMTAGKDGAWRVEVIAAEVRFHKNEAGKVDYLVLNREGMRQRAGKLADEPDLSTVEERQTVKIDTRLYDAYAGLYEPGENHRIVISRDGDKLFGKVDDGPKLELLPLGKDEFFIRGMPGEVKFGRKNDAVDYIEFEIGEKHQLARRMQATDTPEAAARRKNSRRLAGDWMGRLEIPGGVLQLIARFSVSADGHLVGSMDSPDQGAANIPIFKPALAENRVGFGVPLVHGGFQGYLSEDGKSISGKWFQEHMGIDLVWTKVAKAPSMERTQNPKPPYPYEEEYVRIENEVDKVTLAGTLTHPDGVAKPTVVILLSGSGPQNRDADILGHKPFLVLADHLSRAGIAVLRMDDRGVGQSKGDVTTTGIGHLLSDALTFVTYLKGRDDLGKIGLIGHSEGGAVAAMAAAKSNDVAFIVTLAAPGLPGRDIILGQLEDALHAQQVDDKFIAENRKLFDNLMVTLKANPDDTIAKTKLRKAISDFTKKAGEEVAEKLGYRTNQDRILSNMVTPWYRSFVQLNPADHFSKLTLPVLALIGGKDQQVKVAENTAAIEAALKKAGNSQYQVKVLPGLNHLFQTAETGAFSEYVFLQETFQPGALKQITDWVKAR